jgi:hypothetical protein
MLHGLMRQDFKPVTLTNNCVLWGVTNPPHYCWHFEPTWSICGVQFPHVMSLVCTPPFVMKVTDQSYLKMLQKYVAFSLQFEVWRVLWARWSSSSFCTYCSVVFEGEFHILWLEGGVPLSSHHDLVQLGIRYIWIDWAILWGCIWCYW